MQTWSSAAVPARDRLAFWVEELCGAFLRLQCEPRRGEPFFGQISLAPLGGIHVASMRTTPQQVRRTALELSRDPTESVQICVVQSGRSLIVQDGREAELAAGDIVLSDGIRPFDLSNDRDIAATVLQVPRPVLLQRIGAPECFTALRVSGSAGIGALLSPMLKELPSRLAAIPEIARPRVADNLLDLVAVALLSVDGGAPLSPRLTLTRVKFWIETHLAEKLSGEDIAKRCGLSIRHINRLFEREGTSTMQYLWERRLERCRRDLGDPTLRHTSISDIAFAAGFSDLSHFSRAYRARYGVPPREARRRKV